MSIANSDVNTYNPDGRIIQVEYAMKAMNKGVTTIGIRLADSVILVSEKRIISPLQLTSKVTGHFKIYDTILAGISGIAGDAPTIIKKCRNICLDHEKLFKEQIPITKLMEDICGLALKFGEDKYEKKIYSRPFGISILVAAYQDRPILYVIDPSGSYLEYKARSIGSAQEVVEAILVNEYGKFVDERETIKAALKILDGAIKDGVNENNVEISVVNKNGVFSMNSEDIKEYIPKK